MTSLHVIFGLEPPPIKNPDYAYVSRFSLSSNITPRILTKSLGIEQLSSNCMLEIYSNSVLRLDKILISLVVLSFCFTKLQVVQWFKSCKDVFFVSFSSNIHWPWLYQYQFLSSFLFMPWLKGRKVVVTQCPR